VLCVLKQIAAPLQLVFLEILPLGLAKFTCPTFLWLTFWLSLLKLDVLPLELQFAMVYVQFLPILSFLTLAFSPQEPSVMKLSVVAVVISQKLRLIS
jgi:hypothetical protein